MRSHGGAYSIDAQNPFTFRFHFFELGLNPPKWRQENDAAGPKQGFSTTGVTGRVTVRSLLRFIKTTIGNILNIMDLHF
jgi:hypothetical protein